MDMVKLSRLIIRWLLSVLCLSEAFDIQCLTAGTTVNKYSSKNVLRQVYGQNANNQKRERKKIRVDASNGKQITINQTKDQENSEKIDDKKLKNGEKINVKNQNKNSSIVLKEKNNSSKDRPEKVMVARQGHVVMKKRQYKISKNNPPAIAQKTHHPASPNAQNEKIRDKEEIIIKKNSPSHRSKMTKTAINPKKNHEKKINVSIDNESQAEKSPKPKALIASNKSNSILKIVGEKVNKWIPSSAHAIGNLYRQRSKAKETAHAKNETMKEEQINSIKSVMHSIFPNNKSVDASKIVFYNVTINVTIIIDYKQMAINGLGCDCVEFSLLSRTATGIKQEKTKFSLLHMAILLTDKDRSVLLKKIINEPSFDICLKNSFTYKGNEFKDYTPLHFAIWLEKISAIKELIEIAKTQNKIREILLAKSDCLYNDGAFVKNSTPVHLAIFSEKIQNSAKILSYLIECIHKECAHYSGLENDIFLAKANTQSHGKIIIKGGTPLIFAMMKNDASINKIFEILKNRKIDISDQVCDSLELNGAICENVTPIHVAITFCEFNNLKKYIPELLRMVKNSDKLSDILSVKAQLKTNTLSITDGTILHFAILGEKNSQTTLDIMAHCTDLVSCNIALQSEADMQTNSNLNIQRGTPLFFAMIEGIDNAIKKALELAKQHKIDVTTKQCKQLKFNSTTFSNVTPLHLAIVVNKLTEYVPILLQSAKESESRRVLLSTNANINTTDISIENGTVSHFAAAFSDQSTGNQLTNVANELGVDIYGLKCSKFKYKGKEFASATVEQIINLSKN
ncbi:MAG: hypothetical protein LBH49_02845 [Puniceicoccales bacterium]|jgi:hypothetical protein|nr:hypothetical protein [Puniceicoccales bacterium]